MSAPLLIALILIRLPEWRRSQSASMNDLKFALRQLLKHPGFATVAVLTLALGIGASTALFSVVNGVLLSPLPFPQPDQLVSLHQSKPNFATGAIPYLNFLDWQKENRSFSAMAIRRGASFSLLGTGDPERVSGRLVSAEFFSVLGVEPALGRNFQPGEDVPGAAPVVLISPELWQRKFDNAPDVVGRSLTLDTTSYTIIGVLPRSSGLFRGTDVYVLIGQSSAPALRNRSAAFGLHGIGRLKPGVTIAQAQADLDGVMGRLAEAYPEANRGHGAAILPLKQRLVGDVEPVLWMLLGAVGFVLAVACVNVSNLLLARSTARTSEFAIRTALGAGRWRLLRQLLTESLILALAGGALGLVLAVWGTQAVLAALPDTLPRAEEVGLDGRVLAFSLAISMLAGLLAGLAPALKGMGRSLAETLKAGARGSIGGRHRAQSVLVGVEMALALILLIGAGLMIRSLNALWQVDPGFRPDNVLTLGVSFPPSTSAAHSEAARASWRDLSDRLDLVPGVKAASFSSGAAPLQGEDDLYFWTDREPRPVNNSEMHMALVYRVEPGYLAAMGIPLKQGRFFTHQDDERAPAVVVIDEVFAQQYFPNVDPVGRRISTGSDRDPLEIVGVVGHIKQWNLYANDQESLQAQLYEPLRQVPYDLSGVSLVARLDNVASGTRAATLDSIRRVIRDHHSQNVVFGIQTMNEVIAESLARHRFSMILLNAFAVVALLLAGIGLYGVISHLVGERTREIGIRVALGAQRHDVLHLVVRHGMKMALAGLVVGLLAAMGLTRLLMGMLYDVTTTDPMTFAVITLLMTGVALLACFVPAIRATRVDPMVALRNE